MSMDPGTTTGALPDPTAVKPGMKTSEFWTTVATAVATIVVAVLALFGKHVDGTTLQPLIGAAAVLGATLSTASYSVSRGRVKAAAHTAGASQVPSAPVYVSVPDEAPAPVVPVAPVLVDVPMAADDGVDH